MVSYNDESSIGRTGVERAWGQTTNRERLRRLLQQVKWKGKETYSILWPSLLWYLKHGSCVLFFHWAQRQKLQKGRNMWGCWIRWLDMGNMEWDTEMISMILPVVVTSSLYQNISPCPLSLFLKICNLLFLFCFLYPLLTFSFYFSGSYIKISCNFSFHVLFSWGSYCLITVGYVLK